METCQLPPPPPVPPPPSLSPPVTPVLLSEPPPVLGAAQLAALLTPFRAPYRHLSPAWGALLAQSVWLRQLYAWGPKDDATVKLAHELFHHAAVAEPLRLTRNKSKAAYYLTPERLGEWLGLWVSGGLPQTAPRAALLEPWYRECRCSRKSLERLLDLLGRAEAEAGRYGPWCGVGLLLAALWLRCGARPDVLAYLRALGRHVDAWEPHVPPVLSEAWAGTWLRLSYRGLRPEDPLPALPAHLPAPALEPLLVHVLLLSHRLFPPELKAETLPLVLEPAEPQRPDCAERALRGLLHLLLWDVHAQQLALARLDAFGPLPEVRAFLHAWTGPGWGGREAALQWYQLLQGRAGLRYLRTSAQGRRYELTPSKANLRTALCTLLPGLGPCATWAALGAALSTAWCGVEAHEATGADEGAVHLVLHHAQGVTLHVDLTVQLAHHAFLTAHSLDRLALPPLLVRTLWDTHVRTPSLGLAPLLAYLLALPGVAPELLRSLAPTPWSEPLLALLLAAPLTPAWLDALRAHEGARYCLPLLAQWERALAASVPTP